MLLFHVYSALAGACKERIAQKETKWKSLPLRNRRAATEEEQQDEPHRDKEEWAWSG